MHTLLILYKAFLSVFRLEERPIWDRRRHSDMEFSGASSPSIAQVKLADQAHSRQLVFFFKYTCMYSIFTAKPEDSSVVFNQ